MTLTMPIWVRLGKASITHEPCILCSYVIRHHRILRVVIQQAVAHIGGATSAYPILTANDIPIWGEPPVVEIWGQH